MNIHGGPGIKITNGGMGADTRVEVDVDSFANALFDAQYTSNYAVSRIVNILTATSAFRLVMQDLANNQTFVRDLVSSIIADPLLMKSFSEELRRQSEGPRPEPRGCDSSSGRWDEIV